MRAEFNLKVSDELAAMITSLLAGCKPDLAECSRENAVHVCRWPEEFAYLRCDAMRGQAFLAENGYRQPRR